MSDKPGMSYAEKAHELRDLDLSGAARGVWLVKVPKYLSEKWKKAGNNCDVGKLKISKSRFPGGKQDVIFSLNETLAVKLPGETVQVPKDHKFVITGIASQSLSVLSRTPGAATGPSDFPSENVSVEGKVIQRAECRPVADDNYMKLKRTHLEITNRPKKEVVHLDKVVQNYKPVSSHPANLQAEAKRKEEGKRSRLDREKVMDMLFKAFEDHQYYNVKDLVGITKQPITYLKEILKEICVYNMKAPHKNMWELKPEYRHYKESSGGS